MPAKTQLGKYLALLLAVWLALAPLAALAQAAPPAPAAPVGPTIGEPRINASSTVVKVGDAVTISLENGPGLQEGYFIAKAATLEWNCDGGWRQQCAKPIRIDRNGNVSIQARLTATLSKPLDVIFNFKPTSGATLPAGVIVRFYSGNTRPDPPPPAQPIFLSREINSRYPLGGFYLEGVHADNWLAACADFKDQDGYVEWTVNGKVFAKESGKNWLCSQPHVDMGNLGQGLVPKPINGQYTIEARAYNPSGASPVLAGTFIQVPYSESWFKEVTWIKPPELKGKGDQATYDLEVHLPLQGYRFAAPGFISNRAERNTDAGFTFKGTLSFPVKCKENYDLTARAEGDAFFTNIYLVNAKGYGKVDGSLALRFRTCQLLGAKLVGDLYVGGRADGWKTVKIGDVLVDLFLDPGVIDDILKWLIEFFSDPKMDLAAALDLSRGFRATVDLQPVSPYLQSSAKFDGELGLAGSASIRVAIPELKVSVAGRGTVHFDKNGLDRVDNLPFATDAAYQVDLSIRIPIINISFGKTIRGLCTYPTNGGQSCRKTSGLSSALEAGAWAWTPHPDAAGYALFQGQPLQTPGLAAGQSVTSVLVSQVYTYVNTALTIDPATGHAIALWDHDDIARPVGRSLEIMASSWNGGAWSVPAPLTNDDLMDSLPQIAWTTGGKAMALWHRVEQALAADAAPVLTATNTLEIASAGYEPGAAAWTAPALLTTSDIANYGVELAANPAGKLAAVWIRRADGLAFDAAPQPGAVLAALYDGAWGAPQVVAENLTGLSEVAVGYGAGGATVAYTQRDVLAAAGADAALSPRQVFVAWWDGAQWSAPQQVTNDSRDHHEISLAYNAQSQPLLVWLAGSDLHVLNLATGATASTALEDATSLGIVDSLIVAQDSAGNLAVVLRGQGEQADLYALFFDQAHSLWSAPRRLLTDTAMERSPAPAFDAAGNLHVLYGATQLERVDESTLMDNGEPVTLTLTHEGRTDLMLLEYAPQHNVHVPVDGLFVSEANPAPGAAVTVGGVVANTGDWAAPNLAVSFYDGDPDAGGVLIAAVPLAAPLAAGATMTVTTPYTPPVEGGIRTLYVVADAADAVTEDNETDNRTSLRAFGPNLAFLESFAEPHLLNYVLLNAVVQNIGATTTPSTTLAYHQDVLTGTVQATTETPPLAPGAIFTTSLIWEHPAAATGAYDLVAAVNEGEFEELDTTDNMATFAYGVGPDVALSPLAITAGDFNAAMVPVTVTVSNLGSAPATDITVGFYRDGSLSDATLLLTATLASLPADALAEIAVTVPGPLTCGVYVLADTQAGADLHWGNNLVAAHGPAICTSNVYLPVVGR